MSFFLKVEHKLIVLNLVTTLTYMPQTQQSMNRQSFMGWIEKRYGKTMHVSCSSNLKEEILPHTGTFGFIYRN